MDDRPRVMSLCSGIGGLDLMTKSLGWRTVCYVEQNPYRQRVLRARATEGWLDDAPIWDDIYTLTIDTLCQLLHDACTPEAQEAMDMAAHRKDYAAAVEMYNKGFSKGEAAAYYGVTRQAMWAILKRRMCEFRPQQRFNADNHFFRGTTADDHAHNVTETAISRGILVPQPCEVCGATGVMADGRRLVQAHHDDYNSPLSVRWLCQQHHYEWHIDHRAVPRKEVQSEAFRPIEVDIVVGGFP